VRYYKVALQDTILGWILARNPGFTEETKGGHQFYDEKAPSRPCFVPRDGIPQLAAKQGLPPFAEKGLRMSAAHHRHDQDNGDSGREQLQLADHRSLTRLRLITQRLVMCSTRRLAVIP
jgi:hypothetical protein